MDDEDKVVLMIVATALLIEHGGKAHITREEWLAAIEHPGSVWVNHGAHGVDVVLMPQPVPE